MREPRTAINAVEMVAEIYKRTLRRVLRYGFSGIKENTP